MKVIHRVDASVSPLTSELRLLRGLHLLTACETERLRLTIQGRRLFIDGFVASVNEKFEVEKACKALAPQWTLVNRLRVACTDDPRVS